MGLARAYSSPPPRNGYTPNVVTMWYRAPALLWGCDGDYSAAIDCWALGCIFGELMLGSPLLPGETEIEQLIKIVSLLGSPNEVGEFMKTCARRAPLVPFSDLINNNTSTASASGRASVNSAMYSACWPRTSPSNSTPI